jgi:hypothetical protein
MRRTQLPLLLCHVAVFRTISAVLHYCATDCDELQARQQLKSLVPLDKKLLYVMKNARLRSPAIASWYNLRTGTVAKWPEETVLANAQSRLLPLRAPALAMTSGGPETRACFRQSKAAGSPVVVPWRFNARHRH